MTTPSYEFALREIWERSAYDRGFISNPFAGDDVARLGLKRTAALLDRLGRPQERYRILHVAGSKGKGSTCVFASGILTASGLRTGLYTSPHLHVYRERFRIDGAPIPEDAFAAAWRRTREATEELEAERPELGGVTSFEMLTAMALDQFASARCDAAVIEVGLGGTLDATNVVQPASTAIAALDYEHTRVLGNTMAEIAANKAGIVKLGVPLATAMLPDEAFRVVADVAAEQHAPWLHGGRDWHREGSWRSFAVSGPWGRFDEMRSGLIGDHQADNAGLAVAAVWGMLGGELTQATVRRGIAAVDWPGRFEVIEVGGGRRVILDGAHTPAAAAVLARTFAAEFPGEPATLLLGVLKDKDPLPIARALGPIVSSIVAVTPSGPRGLPAAELAAALASLGLPVRAEADIEAALRQTDGPMVVTGSLTTVAATRETLGLAVPDPPFTRP